MYPPALLDVTRAFIRSSRPMHAVADTAPATMAAARRHAPARKKEGQSAA